MKLVIGFLLLLAPLSAFAGNIQGMNEAQMQQMMQQMQGMQTCMQAIDRSEMKAFEQSAKQMQAEIDALCAGGQRDEAMARAMAFGKEVAANKSMQAMRKCGEGMTSMMPKIATTTTEEGSKHHVCDQ